VTRRGTLILVVGPSGVGKDSIIAGATERLHGDPRVVFARRVITRPSGAGGEDHLAVSAEGFAARRAAGGFMLHWRAHGFDYGLPACLADALAGGCSVVANVSRTVVDEARRRFAPVAVVAVAASPATLAARLARRGRETAAEVERRRARDAAMTPFAADCTIDNDGPLSRAVARFAELVCETLDRPGEVEARG